MRGVTIVVGLACVVALAGPASGDARNFHADVEGGPRNLKRCEVFLCGDAAVEDYGDAKYTRARTSSSPTSKSCTDYTAVDTFTRADGSTLTLDVAGTACAQGKNAPNVTGAASVNGDWTVREASGKFAGLSGEGTTSLEFYGNNFTASYTGTVVD